jgi:HSP20 family protein
MACWKRPRIAATAALANGFSLPYKEDGPAQARRPEPVYDNKMEDVMNLIRRNPSPLSAWRSGSVEDQFGRLVQDMFQDFLSPYGAGGNLPGEDTISPRLQVGETDKTYEIRADMPGVKKDDIKVSIDRDRVTIEAECRTANEQREGENVVYSERSARRFLRSFTLPTEVDDAAAQAKLEDGVLQLTLPKKQGSEAHRLTIQ